MKFDWPKTWAVLTLGLWLLVAGLCGFLACRHFVPKRSTTLTPPASLTEPMNRALPANAATPEPAKATTSIVATQSVRVLIRRPKPVAPGRHTASAVAQVPALVVDLGKTTNGGQAAEEAEAIPGIDDGVEVEVTVEQSTIATAGVSAPPAVAFAPRTEATPEPSYGRVGVMAGTFPGVAAFTFQAVRVPIPASIAGVKVDLGIDLEANLDQAGVALTVGQKAFVGVGGHVTYPRSTPAQLGWHVGVGLRF